MGGRSELKCIARAERERGPERAGSRWRRLSGASALPGFALSESHHGAAAV